MTNRTFAYLGILLTACSAATDPPPQSGIASELQCENGAMMTFADLHAQVIGPACTGCHHGGAGGTAPDMSTAEKGLASTRGVASIGYAKTLKIVDPGAPHTSTMMLKVLGGDLKGFAGPNGETVGGGMPQVGTLSTAQKTAIRDWICSGAQP
ncbi:hypothetical protein [Pendulispora albinea]|uniref:Cytochrome c domain-containing protein n=1 Tax=Pendulispora albinea TaxID=2741071 RepID=A0ABZ2LYK0_9BACT